jgi:hypothetical protein
MFTLINSHGHFLTNYGMQKWWFIDSIEFCYTFDNFQDALRFAHNWQINPNNEELNVYSIYTKF